MTKENIINVVKGFSLFLSSLALHQNLILHIDKKQLPARRGQNYPNSLCFVFHLSLQYPKMRPANFKFKTRAHVCLLVFNMRQKCHDSWQSPACRVGGKSSQVHKLIQNFEYRILVRNNSGCCIGFEPGSSSSSNLLWASYPSFRKKKIG